MRRMLVFGSQTSWAWGVEAPAEGLGALVVAVSLGVRDAAVQREHQYSRGSRILDNQGGS